MVGRTQLLALALAGLFLISCGKRNSPTGPNSVNLILTGQWDSPGYATDLNVRGNYVYLADDQSGFHVLNVADRAHPRLVSTLGSNFYSITMLSASTQVNLLAVVDDNNQRYFYNIADPDSVTAFDGTDSNTRTNDILVIGGSPDAPDADSLMMLFTGDSNDGLTFTLYQSFHFGDVTSWAGIANSETQTYGRTLGVTNDGYLVLTAQDQMGLVIYNYTDYNNPVELGRMDTPGSARRVAVADSIAYIADGRFGVNIISYHDPDSLKQLGQIAIPGYVNDVAVQGNMVIAAAGDGGTFVIDVSNPTASTLVGRYQSSYTYAVETTSDAIFVADRDDGLLIFSLER